MNDENQWNTNEHRTMVIINMKNYANNITHLANSERGKCDYRKWLFYSAGSMIQSILFCRLLVSDCPLINSKFQFMCTIFFSFSLPLSDYHRALRPYVRLTITNGNAWTKKKLRKDRRDFRFYFFLLFFGYGVWMWWKKMFGEYH